MTAAGIPALLEPIQERLDAVSHHGTFRAIAESQEDTARLLAAVKAVVELHKPFTHHFLTPPAGSVEVCLACHEQWPCETVSAVEAALRGEA